MFHNPFLSAEEENLLVKQFAASTLSGAEQLGRNAFVEEPSEKSLIMLPTEILLRIIKQIGKRELNPAPLYENYLSARNGRHYFYKAIDSDYAVKNLMTIRRVSTRFEDIINDLTPGEDYDWVEVDIKIQGFKNSRSATLYKYGGTGSQKPATHLSRIRRFSEYRYEHIQKFEKIRELAFIDLPLTQELFDTVYELDLKQCRKITFERIPYINLGVGVDVPNFIQEFLLTVETRASVFFNSDVFDPNVALFSSPEVENPVENNSNPAEERQQRDDLFEIGNSKRHRQIRRRRTHHMDPKTAHFRDRRTMNILSHVLVDRPHDPKAAEYGTSEGHVLFKKQLATVLRNKTKTKTTNVRKAARWHFKKIFSMIDRKGCHSRKRLLYHLTTLKRLSGEEPIFTDEEETFIKAMNEHKNLDNVLRFFPFFHKLTLPSRLYVNPEPMDH